MLAKTYNQNYSEPSSDNSNLGKIGLKTAREEREERERLEWAERLKQPSASVFLLEEKAKSKKIQDALKKREINQLYKKLLSANITKDTSVPIENKGILVNKTQEWD